MCGITGFIWKSNSNLDGRPQDHLSAMGNAIKHRGPDDSGQWLDKDNRIALAHRRLSIVDLSPAGHQPMFSHRQRYILIFNGEIYNHLSLRKELDIELNSSIQWKGHSDTETLLACFDNWGIEITLHKTVGMFALALWDTQKKQLYLARDRMGEKPLYYGWVNNAFVFGSELKALKSYPNFNNDISQHALSLYLQYNYVPTPYSIYENIYKLDSGCYLSLDISVANHVLSDSPKLGDQNNGIQLHRWWNLDEVIQNQKSQIIGDEEEVFTGLDQCLRESVKIQSIADVPLGAFLSGGIDSSLIVALMQSEAVSTVKTFTIGFSESDHNEAVFAKEVAQHLGTEHTELYLNSTDALNVIPDIPELYDEPFADSSQIPTYLVSKMTKQNVTVSLSGDGGDELFGGYNRYLWSSQLWKKVSWLPFSARKALGRLLLAQSTKRIDVICTWLLNLVSHNGINLIGEKVHKVGDLLLRARSIDELYQSVTTTWKSPLPINRYDEVKSSPTMSSSLNMLSPEERMMYLDAKNYLPDDILCKVDRASMGVSLETRVPFLDHRVIEYAWQIPQSMKIKNGQSKWVLRELLYKHVPREMIERPKQGFSIPLADWLRGPLRDWAEALLARQRLLDEGYFDPNHIRQKWKEHLSGSGNWQHYLWSVLMFQAWLEAQ